MAGDPTDIRRAPVNFKLAIIEHITMREGRIEQITAGGMQHTLRLAG